MKISKRLESFPEYVFSKLAKEVAIVEKASGRKVLSFGAGTPDFPPNQKYIEKLKEFVSDNDAHLYPGYGATKEFDQAIRKYYLKRFAVKTDDISLLPLLGAKDGISHLPLALLDEGDEVLIPNPGYPAFVGPTLMIGAKPVYYDLETQNEYKIDIQKLQKIVSAKTKYLWVNFPSNPTGAVIEKPELSRLVSFARKNNIFLIYDNAYAEISFDGYKAPSIFEVEGAMDVAVELHSFSKTFSFAGFRMGWIIGNQTIVDALTKVKSQMDSGMSLPLQKLGAYALENFDNAWHEMMIDSYKERRDKISTKLKKLGLEFSLPKGGLYIWAKIPDTEIDSNDFAMKLLKERQILVTPGSAFGSQGERYVRVSVCVNIDKIDEYL